MRWSVIVMLWVQASLAAQSYYQSCFCTVEGLWKNCHCEGKFQVTRNSLPPGRIRALSLNRINITSLSKDFFKSPCEHLRELSISNIQTLTTVESNFFEEIPKLEYLKVIHTSLRKIPKLANLGIDRPMHVIDFESNKIEYIWSNNFAVRVDQLFLEYNHIMLIEGWAFNGSEIGKLSFRGNWDLKDISEHAFSGLRSLRELDLSETSILQLPTLGLEGLEILKIRETYSLKRIPSIYDLSNLKRAWLTYSFHCCAFHNPSLHDPIKHQEYMIKMREFCKEKQKRSEREIFSDFGDLVEDHFTTLNYTTINPSKQGLDPDDSSLQTHDNGFPLDGVFHETQAEISTTKINFFCGNLTLKSRVVCWPPADVLNPCGDLMSWSWLRSSVWLVLSTAILGNAAVLFVLLFSRTENSVPRFLMCHLAFADLSMALYLLMLATMDVISSDAYFNYAYDWQRGVGCKVAGFLTVFASQLSLFSLSVLTLERWFAIRHALHLNLLDLRVTARIMFGGWAYSLFMAALPLFGISSYSSTSICLPMETEGTLSKMYILGMILAAGLAFLLICVCYLQIYLSLSQETRHSFRRGEGSVARKMTILVGVNLLCWAPVAFFALTALAGHSLIDVTHSKILLVFIYPINSCANPYLYAILTKQYRKDFMQLLSKYVQCRLCEKKNKMGYSRPAFHDIPSPMTTAETLI